MNASEILFRVVMPVRASYVPSVNAWRRCYAKNYESSPRAEGDATRQKRVPSRWRWRATCITIHADLLLPVGQLGAEAATVVALIGSAHYSDRTNHLRPGRIPMPQINGACFPPICYTIKYDVTGAKMEVRQLQPNGAYALDANLTARLPAPIGQLLVGKFNGHKAKRVPPVKVKCDGCNCAAVGPIKGFPLPVPDEEIDSFPIANQTDGKAHIFVTGITARIRVGYCVNGGIRIFDVDPKGNRTEVIPQPGAPDLVPPGSTG
jgi:hypothetical protein